MEEETATLEQLKVLVLRRRQFEDSQKGRLREMKAEEERLQRNIREHFRQEKELEDRVFRLKKEDELQRRKVADYDLPKGRPEVARPREKSSERDTLQALFKMEQKIAHEISEEIRKREAAKPDGHTGTRTHTHVKERPDEVKPYEKSSVTPSSGKAVQIDTKPYRYVDERPDEKIYRKLSVTPFSGTEPVPKNECSFELWTLEVESLISIYPDYLVSHAIRHSLRGEARRVLLPLGPQATTQDIMDKMESVFGNVVSGESVLQQFYSSRQDDRESVTSWGLRLEETLQKAIRKGQIKPTQRNEMLRTKSGGVYIVRS